MNKPVKTLLLAGGLLSLALAGCDKQARQEAAQCKDQLNQAQQELTQTKDQLGKAQTQVQEVTSRRDALEKEVAQLRAELNRRTTRREAVGSGSDVPEAKPQPAQLKPEPPTPEPGATRLRRK